MNHYYNNWMHLFQMHPKYITILNGINIILTAIAFCLYPLLIGLMLFRADKQVIALVFVPAFCFAAVSVIRKLLHFPRPYDLYHFQPVIPREKKGDSFPSRHVFSIFLIATLWFGIFEPVGIFLFAAGIILALIRVFGGVHFPKDVLCGAAIGIICGILTLFICTL